ncbi:Low affinity cationic amino acid transporter 2-like protein, partial [Dinothrombium tinctorium]
MCYAEFSARVPHAGSAYVYCYTTVGEIIAFFVGWNLILEYIIGTASIAKGVSVYIDTLTNNKTIASHFEQLFPIELPSLSPFFDFIAFSVSIFAAGNVKSFKVLDIIIVSLTAILAVGVKESALFTNILTAINLLVVLFVTVSGLIKFQNFENWKLPPHNGDKGGFFPFGFVGLVKGAARGFYGFVGFDAIATAGDEAINPQRYIPISLFLSLLVVLFSFIGTSVASTLMQPYYEQTGNAPLANLFVHVGFPAGRYIVAIGALANLTTAIVATFFPLPRVIFAMASDGLLPKFFSIINRNRRTPIIATFFGGIFIGIMAALFTIAELADMMSIGTLLAYSLVALSILILRYQNDKRQDEEQIEMELQPFTYVTQSVEVINQEISPEPKYFWQFFCSSTLSRPTAMSAKISNILIFMICLLVIAFVSFLHFMENELFKLEKYAIVLALTLLLLLIAAMILLQRLPQARCELSFKVPCLPFFPVLSMFFNIYLMTKLDPLTWFRFIVWLIIGFLMYFSYGIFVSTGYLTESEKSQKEEERRRLTSSSLDEPQI